MTRHAVLVLVLFLGWSGAAANPNARIFFLDLRGKIVSVNPDGTGREILVEGLQGQHRDREHRRRSGGHGGCRGRCGGEWRVRHARPHLPSRAGDSRRAKSGEYGATFHELTSLED